MSVAHRVRVRVRVRVRARVRVRVRWSRRRQVAHPLRRPGAPAAAQLLAG